MAVVFTSCGTWNNTTKGTAIGVGGGAAVGAGVGALAGNTALGSIIGAAVGGTAGALIGKKMDKQKKELEAELEAALPEEETVMVESINEGQALKVTFDSGILFDFNSSKLSADAQASLTKFSEVLKATPDADVAILGHTDNIGTEKANQSVSEKRAKAVADFLKAQGVSASQIKDVLGMNYSQPVASNDTEEGRAQNRRVEVYMYASQAMIDAANAEAAK